MILHTHRRPRWHTHINDIVRIIIKAKPEIPSLRHPATHRPRRNPRRPRSSLPKTDTIHIPVRSNSSPSSILIILRPITQPLLRSPLLPARIKRNLMLFLQETFKILYIHLNQTSH